MLIYPSSSYILDINAILDISYANIFSQSQGSFFLFDDSFIVENPFSLIRSHLFNFAFIFLF